MLAEQPAEKPIDRRAEQAAEQLAGQFAEQLAEQPAEQLEEQRAEQHTTPEPLALGDTCVFQEDVRAAAEGYLTARSGTVATVLHVEDGWAYGRTEEMDGWFSLPGPFRVLPAGVGSAALPPSDGLASGARS